MISTGIDGPVGNSSSDGIDRSLSMSKVSSVHVPLELQAAILLMLILELT